MTLGLSSPGLRRGGKESGAVASSKFLSASLSFPLMQPKGSQHHGQFSSHSWFLSLLMETSPFLPGQCSPSLGFWPRFRSWAVVTETVLTLISITKKYVHHTRCFSHPFQYAALGCHLLFLPPSFSLAFSLCLSLPQSFL